MLYNKVEGLYLRNNVYEMVSWLFTYFGWGVMNVNKIHKKYKKFKNNKTGEGKI